MKKMFLVMLSLLVVSMFLVGCTTEEISDEELEAELSDLSAEELDQAIEAVEAEDSEALAGQAYMKRTSELSRNIPKDRFLKIAYKERLKKVYLSQCDSKCMENYGTHGLCGGSEGYLSGFEPCEGQVLCVCSPATCNSDGDCKDKHPYTKCTNNKCDFPRCDTKCMQLFGTSGVCGGEEGEMIGAAYCLENEQCMCQT
jgi:hypothetical protein